MWEWDEDKRLKTLALRGLDFRDISILDLAQADLGTDARRDYGEVRIQAVGFIGGLLMTAIITPRPPNLRLISLRRANVKE
jgi:uncharacterized protein